jgi:CheY-like chemotaxis protein
MAKQADHGKTMKTAKKEIPALKKRVLLVDDDVDFLEINKTALEAAGYEVVVAHDAREGLKIAGKGKLDVAILDVIMATPSDGFELARDLRKDPKTEKVPLVMLTSVNAVNEQKGTLFRLGNQDRDELWLPIDKFVDKPIKPEALVRIVAELTKP